MMGGGMQSGMQMEMPAVPAPMVFVAFLFGIMLGTMMSRKRMMMMGMHGGMGMGMGGHGKMGMSRGMMMHHHHHGAGEPCCCGKSESGEQMPRGGDRTD
jgi:putative effector of murein hydrolase